MSVWPTRVMWRQLAERFVAGLRGLAGPVMEPTSAPSAAVREHQLMARDVERFVGALWRREICADDFAQ